MLLSSDMCLNSVYAWRVLGIILYIIRVLVPVVLLVIAIKPFFDVVVKGTSKDMGNALRNVLFKLFAGIIIFLTPTLINSVFKMLVDNDNSDFLICTTCMDSPINSCKQYIDKYDNLVKNEEKKFDDIPGVEGKSDELDKVKEQEENNNGNNGNSNVDSTEYQADANADVGQVEFPDGSGDNGIISGDLEVHFINPSSRVDAIYIKVGDKGIFIDGGFKNDGKREMAYMDKIGVKSIDYYIGTHSHKNHVEAAPGIIKKYGIKNVLVGRDKCNGSGGNYCSWYAIKIFANEQKVDLSGVSVKAFLPGESFTLNGLKLTAVGPINFTNSNNRGDTAQNKNSVIIRLDYGNKSFMLTGDNSSSGNIQDSYEKYGDLMKVDVLKNAHHNGTTSLKTLKIFNPKYVVFTTADGYMPSSECISNINSIGAKYFIVADSKNGNVVFSTDGNTLNVKANYNP